MLATGSTAISDTTAAALLDRLIKSGDHLFKMRGLVEKIPVQRISGVWSVPADNGSAGVLLTDPREPCLTMFKWHAPKGCHMLAHRHGVKEILAIESGVCCEVLSDTMIEAGQSVRFPAHTVHEFLFPEDTVMIVAFVPSHRLDLIDGPTK